jgi:hypothetical protein
MHTILCPLGGPGSCFEDVSDGGGRWWELKLGSTRTELYSTSDDKYVHEFPKTETYLHDQVTGTLRHI